MFRFALVAGVLLLQVTFAQQFNGSFVDQVNGVTINLQQAADGSLQGVLVGPSGQWPMQGNSQQSFAAGIVQSQQGVLGFQAQLGPDGQMLQISFYEMDAQGRAVGQGQQLTLQRQGGAAPGGMPGAAMPSAPMTPGAPSAPGVPGGQAGWPPPPPGAVITTTPPGQAPGPAGMQPAAPQGPFGTPAGTPQGPFGASPAAPGSVPQQQAVWNGTFVGNNGAMVLSVQEAQGGYVGYLQDQGQRYPFEAHLDDQTLHGEFMANGAAYEFWVVRDGPTAVLYVGDSSFQLQQASNQATP